MWMWVILEWVSVMSADLNEEEKITQQINRFCCKICTRTVWMCIQGFSFVVLSIVNVVVIFFVFFLMNQRSRWGSRVVTL